MINTNYEEGRDELILKVRERDQILKEVHDRIQSYFVFKDPESRAKLLHIWADIREILVLGGDWGDCG